MHCTIVTYSNSSMKIFLCFTQESNITPNQSCQCHKNSIYIHSAPLWRKNQHNGFHAKALPEKLGADSDNWASVLKMGGKSIKIVTTTPPGFRSLTPFREQTTGKARVPD